MSLRRKKPQIMREMRLNREKLTIILTESLKVNTTLIWRKIKLLKERRMNLNGVLKMSFQKWIHTKLIWLLGC